MYTICAIKLYIARLDASQILCFDLHGNNATRCFLKTSAAAFSGSDEPLKTAEILDIG